MTDPENAAIDTFESLDWYGRWCLYTGGTGFTAYEEVYDDEEASRVYCKTLNGLASAWAFTQAATGTPERPEKGPRPDS